MRMLIHTRSKIIDTWYFFVLNGEDRASWFTLFRKDGCEGRESVFFAFLLKF